MTRKASEVCTLCVLCQIIGQLLSLACLRLLEQLAKRDSSEAFGVQARSAQQL